MANIIEKFEKILHLEERGLIYYLKEILISDKQRDILNSYLEYKRLVDGVPSFFSYEEVKKIISEIKEKITSKFEDESGTLNEKLEEKDESIEALNKEIERLRTDRNLIDKSKLPEIIRGALEHYCSQETVEEIVNLVSNELKYT